ncbi:hypothetical protein [Acidianus brierleyi]|uniref:hypothetical protein n=1 Tax=Acidianus brierleyi TaxID=41673 RepID=UPI001FEABAB7|nr:hypothetical protein [Acidianus brierleyi]
MIRYSYYLLGSSISLFIGGIMLIGKVPLILTISTLIIVIFLIYLAYSINSKKKKALINLGLVLGILSIIISATSPAHFNALKQFGNGYYITILDILMILGFYGFPLAYIIEWLTQMKKSKV